MKHHTRDKIIRGVHQADGPNRTEALRALNELGSVLYAVRLSSGLIKIGYSAHLYERMSHLTGVRNAELLAFCFGDMSDELAVHQSLNAHAAYGREYYHPTAEVLAVVNQWREDLGMEPCGEVVSGFTGDLQSSG